MPAQPANRRRCDENKALVLDLLREANGPLGAYDISSRASARGIRIVPNQVYRTLNRLIDERSVVRIEALNAYLPRQSAGNLCLICKDCHMVEFVTLPSLSDTIARAAPDCHFETVEGLIEAQGQCIECHRARAVHTSQ